MPATIAFSWVPLWGALLIGLGMPPVEPALATGEAGPPVRPPAAAPPSRRRER